MAPCQACEKGLSRPSSLDVGPLPPHKGRRTSAGVRGRRPLISSGLADTGGSYCSQNVMPVHVATGAAARVDLEVTSMGKDGRRVTRVAGFEVTAVSRPLTVRVR